MTVFAILTAMLLITAGGAAAAPPPPPPTPGATIVEHVEMTLDCAHLSKKALDYAVAHDYCPDPNIPQPANTVYGTCGFSDLYMQNAGSGRARFSYGFGSILGTVVRRNLVISWYNWSLGGGGNQSDSGNMFSAVYSGIGVTYTRAGFVTGVMSGTVTLVWGGTCVLKQPTSSAQVTW